MSGVCGWAGVPAENGASRRTIEHMAAALARPGSERADALTVGRAAVAAAGLAGTVSAARVDGILAVVLGNPHCGPDRRSPSAAGGQTPAVAIANAYRERGADFLTGLSGAFSLAVVDGNAGTALLAIDPMGIHEMYYAANADHVVFGSSLNAIVRNPDVRVELSRQEIFHYVCFHMIPAPGTVYAGISRLLPGECLLYRDGTATRRSFHQLKFVENDNRRFPQLRREFLDILERSVARAADGGGTAAFLSGGTDSSTVAGMLGKVSGEPARTYSIGFAAEGFDEIEYARITARHFSTRQREYYVTPEDIVAAVPGIVSVCDQPFGNSSIIPTYYCAKMAKEDGVRRMLAGDGGDELFGGNERYAKQYVFSLYERVPAAVRRGAIEPLLSTLAGHGPALARKAQSYVQQANVPMPRRLWTYNLVTRLGAERIFEPDFLSGIDVGRPVALLEETYRAALAGSLINRMLALDMRFTLADSDLPKVNRGCELAGMEVAYPLLDSEVVDFSLSLAPDMKLKGTRLRYFFKEALTGFLAPETIAKKKHGFGLPFGPWLAQNRNLSELAHDSLGALRKRHIVRSEFLDELTSTHVKSHADYYGTMVWVLMMLEQWFRLHDDRR